MKFKLPRPIVTDKIREILAREVRKQGISVIRAKKEHMKEISQVSHAIKKEGLPKHLLCKKLPHGLGYGIFLHPKAKPLVRGQIIAPYSGEVLLIPQNFPNDSLYAFEPVSDMLFSKEEQLYFDKTRRYHSRRLYAMHVDAAKKGNFTRFINHSAKPNVEAKFFKISSNTYGLDPSPIEVVYVVKKTIHPGEQLLVSYEGEDHSYWSSLDIQPIPITPKTFQLNGSLKVIGSL